jgi:hypothetical protein
VGVCAKGALVAVYFGVVLWRFGRLLNYAAVIKCATEC